MMRLEGPHRSQEAWQNGTDEFFNGILTNELSPSPPA
jgi:hypothetical protein